MSIDGVAVFVKDVSELGFTGTAYLYKVDPPVEFSYEDDEDEDSRSWTSYVVVSATWAIDTGMGETYIFPADEHGHVLNWGELDGSFRGGCDILQALSNAGYRV